MTTNIIQLLLLQVGHHMGPSLVSYKVQKSTEIQCLWEVCLWAGPQVLQKDRWTAREITWSNNSLRNSPQNWLFPNLRERWREENGNPNSELIMFKSTPLSFSTAEEIWIKHFLDHGSWYNHTNNWHTKLQDLRQDLARSTSIISFSHRNSLVASTSWSSSLYFSLSHALTIAAAPKPPFCCPKHG